MKTKVIVEIITSERDMYGNCYHLARFYNPAKGRQESVNISDAVNAKSMAYELAGNDWEATLEFESTVPKREWQRIQKYGEWFYPGSQEAKDAFYKLFKKVPKA